MSGALFLDGGFAAAQRIIETLFASRFATLPPFDELKDAKTRLQEYLQSRGLPLPRYSVERIEGEPHERMFHVVCKVKGVDLATEGSGSSRRRAEQEAAEHMLLEIRSRT